MDIQNNKECFVQLWLRLERTRRLLGAQYKRFCIRNILKAWFGFRANDDFIWKVCRLCGLEGWNVLPPPLYNRITHRELLRAVVAAWLGVGIRNVNQRVIDDAYNMAFQPHR